MKIAVLVVDGHGFQEFQGRCAPSASEAESILKFLADQGMTHFDCTGAKEQAMVERLRLSILRADPHSNIQLIGKFSGSTRESVIKLV